MRFEFKIDDVMALIHLIDISLDYGHNVHISERATTFNQIEQMIKKVKFYGLSAFFNRETYRNEIKRLEGRLTNVRNK